MKTVLGEAASQQLLWAWMLHSIAHRALALPEIRALVLGEFLRCPILALQEVRHYHLGEHDVSVQVKLGRTPYAAV